MVSVCGRLDDLAVHLATSRPGRSGSASRPSAPPRACGACPSPAVSAVNSGISKLTLTWLWAPEVVDLVRLDRVEVTDERRRVGQIRVVKEEPGARLVGVVVEVVDPAGRERARPPDQAVDLVALLEQQLREIRAVLAGDARHEGNGSRHLDPRRHGEGHHRQQPCMRIRARASCPRSASGVRRSPMASATIGGSPSSRVPGTRATRWRSRRRRRPRRRRRADPRPGATGPRRGRSPPRWGRIRRYARHRPRAGGRLPNAGDFLYVIGPRLEGQTEHRDRLAVEASQCVLDSPREVRLRARVGCGGCGGHVHAEPALPARCRQRP